MSVVANLLSIITPGQCPVGEVVSLRSTHQGNHTIASTVLCIFPLAGSPGTILDDILAWLTLMLRRSPRLCGTNSESLLAVFKCTVFIISKVIWTDIRPTSEAENTCFAIARGGKQGTTDTNRDWGESKEGKNGDRGHNYLMKVLILQNRFAFG